MIKRLKTGDVNSKDVHALYDRQDSRTNHLSSNDVKFRPHDQAGACHDHPRLLIERAYHVLQSIILQ